MAEEDNRDVFEKAMDFAKGASVGVPVITALAARRLAMKRNAALYKKQYGLSDKEAKQLARDLDGPAAAAYGGAAGVPVVIGVNLAATKQKELHQTRKALEQRKRRK